MNDKADLIPVFIPALSALLIDAEDRKSEPLTSDEVLSIRDGASCIMMTRGEAAKLAETRGYFDLDPENCWYDWQMLRRELGRKPDLDVGARVDMFQSSDTKYQECVVKARATLDEFRDLVSLHSAYSCLIKTELHDGRGNGLVWLFNTKIDGNDFIAELFEVPPTVSLLQVGQEFRVATDDVIDWMVNLDGILHGGYSLRYHRAKLPTEERSAFDQHIGVTKYV